MVKTAHIDQWATILSAVPEALESVLPTATNSEYTVLKIEMITIERRP